MATTPYQPLLWQLREHQFNWGERTFLMGILNTTPDSFSDGGQFDSLDTALAQAEQLVNDGIDILDIGGQSTRPQAVQISLDEEIARVIPVIQTIRKQPQPKLAKIPISVDTTRAEVAAAAIAAGADLINDVSGGTEDPAMLKTVAGLQVPIILMHRRGNAQTMQQMTDYHDLIAEVSDFLRLQKQAAITACIPAHYVAFDPGIGFAKTWQQSLELLRHTATFRALGAPLLVGPSRKSFIGHVLNQPDAQQRVWGTAAACSAAIAGGADILRVHDGAQMRDVCRVADAIWRSQVSRLKG
jgi:dihydropteroate synthase